MTHVELCQYRLIDFMWLLTCVGILLHYNPLRATVTLKEFQITRLSQYGSQNEQYPKWEDVIHDRNTVGIYFVSPL
jgi:hypothetical protein